MNNGKSSFEPTTPLVSAEDSQESLTWFKVQILGYDHYQWPPSCLDKKISTINGKVNNAARWTISSAPIIRVYGKLPTGHTCVTHIHDVFPYIYIRYIGKVINHNEKEETVRNIVNSELIKLQSEINFCLKESFTRGKRTSNSNSKRKSKRAKPNENYETEDITDEDEEHDSDPGNVSESTDNYVADISLVKGVPFYGYHLGHSPFIKISLTNPLYMVRLTKLLHECKIFGKFIQPFEAHVPYQLQFLTDYNLFSMDWLRMSEFFFRSPIIYTNNDESLKKPFQPYFETELCDFNKIKINDDLQSLISLSLDFNQTKINILKSETFPRISRTIIEIDTCASFILNRRKLTERDIHSKLFEQSTTLEKCVGYFDSTRTLLNDVRYLRKLRKLTDDDKYKLFEDIKRTFKTQEWSENEELMSLFNKCVSKAGNQFTGDLSKVNELSLRKFQWLNKYPSSFTHIDLLHIDIKTSGVYLSEMVTMDATLYLHKDNKQIVLNELLNVKSDSQVASLSQHMLESLIDDVSFDEYDGGKGDEDNNDFNQQIDEDRDENDNFLGEIPHFTNSNQEKDTQDEEPENGITKSLYEASMDEITDVSTVNQSDFQIFAATQRKVNESITHSSVLETSQDANEHQFTNYFTDFHPLEKVFQYIPDSNHFKPRITSATDFMNTFEDKRYLKIEYKDPYFSKLSNYDTEPFYYAGKKFQLKCEEIENDGSLLDLLLLTKPQDDHDNEKRIWKYIPKPPSFEKIQKWVKENQETQESVKLNNSVFRSQIRGPTQKMKQFKYPSIQTPVERRRTHSLKLLMLTIEIYTVTRGELTPDPTIDEIQAIFWKYDSDSFYLKEYSNSDHGVFVNHSSESIFQSLNNTNEMEIQSFNSEKDMAIALVSLVELIDPDILAGFEVNSLSWGYLIERFRKVHKIDILQRLSRVIYKNKGKLKDSYGYRHSSGVKVTGRHVLNIWRQMRHEVTLGHYSLENIVFHVFHKRLPIFSSMQLNSWWKSGDSKKINIVLQYMMNRLKLTSALVINLEVIEKISEQSKLLGCDFHSMIYRGSQFKVECLLVRLAKEENYILISPSKKQVFAQDSLKCIPLVMEPQSGFYKSPLVVLDFQSLYPSLIIAYNICYSTYLGKLEGFDPSKYTKAGVTNHKLQPGVLKSLEKYVNVTPNGMMFAKSNVRQSLLAKMLIEILDARILVKGTMSKFKDDQELNKLYNNRQLGLKLIANVTYGYTSASYSGRMPNSDIADAIVSCGRETLLKAIKEIESDSKWGAKVIYGDTDSLFIYLPGKTKMDAFRIGRDMAQRITEMNPSPMKLKFEKVYLPSVLLSKKRYIGWSFEYEQQLNPKFDAKGIETVRRDGIPAQAKILEKCLDILFKSRDISEVKTYVLNEFIKVKKGKVNLQDLLFCKEVRIGTYKNEAYLPPGARVSMKKMENDSRAQPQYRERVFYVVRKGNKDEILRDRCLSPADFIKDKTNEIDSDYYIDKVLVPPLERVFMLIGVNIRKWVNELPKHVNIKGLGNLNVRLANCMICGSKVVDEKNICGECSIDELGTISKLNGTLKQKQIKVDNINRFCMVCSRSQIKGLDIKEIRGCENEDCGVYYDRVKREYELGKYCSKLEDINDSW